MDIKELIETISECGSEWAEFNITMMDTHSPMYAREVACCDYFGTYSETKVIRGSDDAIGFLFDCDIHLWNLVSVERTCVKGSSSTVCWNIVLRR